MDYSEMSDFEIALTVGKLTSFDGISCVGSSGKAHIHDWSSGLCTGWKEFDPCNSWADAGPIIQDNLICLSPAGYDDSGKVLWTAFCNLKGARTINPLRSAMIAFMMMHDKGEE